VSDSARNAVQHLTTTTAFNNVRHLETENGKNLHNPYFVAMHVKIPVSYSAVERTQQQQPTQENVEDKQTRFEQNSESQEGLEHELVLVLYISLFSYDWHIYKNLLTKLFLVLLYCKNMFRH